MRHEARDRIGGLRVDRQMRHLQRMQAEDVAMRSVATRRRGAAEANRAVVVAQLQCALRQQRAIGLAGVARQ